MVELSTFWIYILRILILLDKTFCLSHLLLYSLYQKRFLACRTNSNSGDDDDDEGNNHYYLYNLTTHQDALYTN